MPQTSRSIEQGHSAFLQILKIQKTRRFFLGGCSRHIWRQGMIRGDNLPLIPIYTRARPIPRPQLRNCCPGSMFLFGFLKTSCFSFRRNIMKTSHLCNILFLLIDFIFIKQPAAAQDYHLWSWFCFILLLGGKMRNIAMQLVLQQCCKTSCMYLLPFSPCLNILYSLFFTSVNLTIPLNSSHLTTTTEHN